MADKRISQLIERVDIANNDVLPIVASGATTTNKVTISTIQDFMQSNLDVGVTSVGLTMPSAFQVSGSPITTSGNITVTATGTASQYIRGDGTLADFPTGGGGGGASVSYYLNGSVSQGTIGGIAYREMNKVPILGAGTDFSISSNGYIASFITDAGDPGLLEIPGGNWNFETYFQASSGGGTPSFYIELYKVNSGGTATLIASNSANPEFIAFGTTTTAYFSSLAVPTTTLTITDRLALRYYVTHSGRTITLHTENSHLCQIITTFTTGLTALNGLTAQVQNFATGTSGTDFNISSTGSTHTFNLPDASASNRGAVTTGTQTFAGYKIFNGTIGVNNDLQLATVGTALNTFIKNINSTGLTSIGSNGFGFNNANNIYFSGSSKGGGVFAFNNTGTQTYTLQDASGTLAFTSDLGNYIQGVGTADSIPKFTGARTIANSAIRDTANTVVISKNVSVDNGASQAINLTPASSGTTNRIETTGTLPLAIITSGLSITLAAGGVTPQITLASTGAVTFSSGFVSFGNNGYIRNDSAGWLQLQGGSNGTRIMNAGNSSAYLSIAESTGAATFSSSVTGTSFSLGTGNGRLSTSGFWGTQITAGTGSFSNFALLDAATNGIMYNPAGTLNMVFTGNVQSVGLRSIDAANTWSFSTGSNASTPNIVALGTISGTPSIQGFNFGFSANQNLCLQPQSGSVGIGTSVFPFSPRLSVNSTGQNTIAVQTTDTAQGSTGTIMYMGTGATTGNSTYGVIRVLGDGGTAASNLVLQPTSGNVGIGTASPNARLEVRDGTGVNFRVRNNGSNNLLLQSYNDSDYYRNMQLAASTIQFLTGDEGGLSATEKMRITSGGFLKASNTGSYWSSGGSYHELVSNSGGNWIAIMPHSASNPFGIYIPYTGASPNNTGNEYLYFADSSTVRFGVRSNGGVVNFQANNVNLSDERTKTEIEPLESYWDKFKEIEIVKFKYKDQTHDDFNIGVIAQQVEAVAPEFVDVDGWDTRPKLDEEGNEIVSEEEPLKSIYTADLYHASIKVLQEAMAKIEKLEAEIEALKSQING